MEIVVPKCPRTSKRTQTYFISSCHYLPSSNKRSVTLVKTPLRRPHFLFFFGIFRHGRHFVTYVSDLKGRLLYRSHPNVVSFVETLRRTWYTERPGYLFLKEIRVGTGEVRGKRVDLDRRERVVWGDDRNRVFVVTDTMTEDSRESQSLVLFETVTRDIFGDRRGSTVTDGTPVTEVILSHVNQM